MYEEIVKHFLSVICTSESFLSDKRCEDPDLLFPPFREKINDVIVRYKVHDSNTPLFFETFRSNKRQADMFETGASDIRVNGMHHYGIAVDLVGKNKNGNWNWSVLNYDLIRNNAKGIGLTLLDKEDCHVQLIPKSQQTMLRRAIFQGVKDFQKANKLVSDGIVGPKTIEALKIAFVKGYKPKTDNT